MAKRLAQKQFVEKAISKHNHMYDYSLVKYVNSHTKIKIICPKHGIFEQIPNNMFKMSASCQKNNKHA